jgi:hypothetical protein
MKTCFFGCINIYFRPCLVWIVSFSWALPSVRSVLPWTPPLVGILILDVAFLPGCSGAVWWRRHLYPFGKLVCGCPCPVSQGAIPSCGWVCLCRHSMAKAVLRVHVGLLCVLVDWPLGADFPPLDEAAPLLSPPQQTVSYALGVCSFPANA